MKRISITTLILIALFVAWLTTSRDGRPQLRHQRWQPQLASRSVFRTPANTPMASESQAKDVKPIQRPTSAQAQTQEKDAPKPTKFNAHASELTVEDQRQVDEIIREIEFVRTEWSKLRDQIYAELDDDQYQQIVDRRRDEEKNLSDIYERSKLPPNDERFISTEAYSKLLEEIGSQARAEMKKILGRERFERLMKTRDQFNEDIKPDLRGHMTIQDSW